MALSCPRCEDVELEEIEVGEVIIDRCVQCAGIWFDSAEITSIVGPRARISNFESIVPGDDYCVDSMKCPRCQGVSLRRFLTYTPTDEERIAYRCVSCIGTWLDRGELRASEDPQLSSTLKNYFSEID
jgi:Zn-finger nucleic acid-binding protein